jgi:hypothetical protein
MKILAISILALLPFFGISQNGINLKLKICNGQINKRFATDASKVKLYYAKDSLSRDLIYIGKSSKDGEIALNKIDSFKQIYKYVFFKSAHTEDVYINIGGITTDTTLFLPAVEEVIFIGKPAIYLYPQKESVIKIKLEFKGEIKTTYPKYNNGWSVIASPDGVLFDSNTNRSYNYLFWDGFCSFQATHFQYKDGFVVSGDNTSEFLYKKLSLIGMNQTEINDFIIYWLPKLELNKYNLIHFWVNNDFDNTSKLIVTPKPATMLTIYMEYKPLEKKIEIPEQQLQSNKRIGFTVVEWGGSEVDNNKNDIE